MGAVQFDAVEADPLRVRGGVGERTDDVVEVGAGHRHPGPLGAVDPDAGGADRRSVRVRRLALLADHADVPQLGHDRAARLVHGRGDLGPPRQLLLAVEPRHPVALPGGVVTDVGASVTIRPTPAAARLA